MTVSNLSREGCWWAAPGVQDGWESGNLQSGTPSQGGNYRSKVAFSTAGIAVGRSKKLIVKVTLYQQSNPVNCMGVLSANGDIPYDQVQNSDATAMSSTLASSAIATSVALKADGTAYTDGYVAAGNVFYFVFNTEDIKPNKTYYVYVIRTATTRSWVYALSSNVSATVEVMESSAYIYDGTDNVPHGAYIYNGSDFVRHIPYIYNGEEWVPKVN